MTTTPETIEQRLDTKGKRVLPPGPRGRPVIGSVLELRKNTLQFFLDLQQNYGDIAYFRVGPRITYFITHPDDIRHVLQDNHRNYRKSSVYRQIAQLIGNGLVTSEGDFWLRQRRLAQPAFHRQRINGFAQTMTDLTETMLARWQPVARADRPLDVTEEMMRLALEIVSQTLLGTNVSDEANVVGSALTTGLKAVGDRINSVIILPPSWPTPGNIRFRRAMAVLDQIVYQLIDERRRTGQDTGDLLSMLVFARDEETGATMNDLQLHDEVMTMFIAGHETTGNALNWLWYLLALHPDVERRLHAEVDSVLGGRIPSVADVPNLPYTRMVIDETLRIYTPAWFFARNTIGPDRLSGYDVPANTDVMLSTYVTHRHPDFWPDPERFDPERFTPERSAARTNFAYIPFAGGPRQRIGNSFALLEAVLVAATIAQKYRLALVPGQTVIPDPILTLRPREGIRMTLHERK